MDTNLQTISALLQLTVLSRTTVLPGSPADGSIYIVRSDDLLNPNKIALRDNGTYYYLTPTLGCTAWVQDTNDRVVWNGADWTMESNVGLRHTDITAVTTLDKTYLGRVVRADATGGAFNVTLPATANADDWVIVRKKDATTIGVKVKVSTTEVAWLSAQYDEVMFAWWGGAWTPVRWSVMPITDVFTASGTWTKAPLAQRIEPTVIGAGAGAGAGRRGAAGSARSGGQAGMSGVLNRWSFPASSLSATETVTVGAGGAGAAGQTVDSTDGAAATAGGNSSFGAHLIALGGLAGTGGSSATLAATTFLAALSGAQAPGVAASPVTSSPSAGSAAAGPAGGGNGGGISTGNVGFAGAVGGDGSVASNTKTNGGSAGAAGANNGTTGDSITDNVNQFGGAGGGGGGGNSAGAGGNGGAGGSPGGGGGGGGASLNGNASGAGGNGARGEVRVTTYFEGA
jgi:hypothetical protein